MAHTYTKKNIVYLEFKFKWALYVLSGNPNPWEIWPTQKKSFKDSDIGSLPRKLPARLPCQSGSNWSWLALPICAELLIYLLVAHS